MSVRNVLRLLIVFVFVGGGVWLAQLNRQAVTVGLPGLDPVRGPLWAVVGLTFLAGILTAVLYSLAVSSRDAWRRRREGPSGQEEVRLAEALRQGVEATLRGELEAARDHLEMAARRRPDDPDAWLVAGDAARAAGDPRAAHEMHLRARGLAPGDPRVIEALSRDAEASGEIQRAIERLRERLEAGGSDVSLYGRLRDLLVSACRWQEAVEAQRQLLARLDDPGRRRQEERRLSGLRLAHARQLLVGSEERGPDEGTVAEARSRLDELTEEAPGFVPGWLALAEARAREGDVEGAIETLAAGFARTRSLEALRRRVDLSVEAERPEEAIRALKDAVAELEGDEGLAARILLGRLYHRLGLVDEARAELDRVADETSFSPVVDYYRAKQRARDGHHQAAYELLKSSFVRAGGLEHRYACTACGAEHERWADRCDACSVWGEVRMDISREARRLEPVVAPRV